MNGAEQKIYISNDERIDDLQFKGMKIIQSEKSFRFGTDSILLAGFTKINKNDKCIDLGAGSGVLSILLHARIGCTITAVEIDKDQCERLQRSVELNNITNEITIINSDYIENVAEIGRCKFDCAVCNPPYYRRNCGVISGKGGATHEINADINRIALAASSLLKYGGKIFLCFPADRLNEALFALTNAKIEPKRLRLVLSKIKSRPYLVLIEAKKYAKPGLIIENNLVIYDDYGNYTEEVRKIYHEF